jgi:hypothetical protein
MEWPPSIASNISDEESNGNEQKVLRGEIYERIGGKCGGIQGVEVQEQMNNGMSIYPHTLSGCISN